MTLQNRHGCEARRAATKREPSPEGLGLNPEDDPSAVGAALNLRPLANVSLGAHLKIRSWDREDRANVGHLSSSY
jgi:hypothetical protein